MENGKKKKIIMIICIVIIILCFGGIIYLVTHHGGSKTTSIDGKKVTNEYRMSGNGLENFDLYFLKLENGEENKVYSPLSIKYALAMLQAGTDGDSKAQLEALIGDYKAKKYENSQNMSLGNALFVRDSFKDNIKNDYLKIIGDKYNASVIYDPFASAETVNNWISDKTFKLINNMLDDEDVTNSDFILANALAIDMEWVKKIQPENDAYYVRYEHETTDDDVYEYRIYDDNGQPTNITKKRNSTHINHVGALRMVDYAVIKFNNTIENAKVSQIAADVNRYDIMKEVGEASIRKTVKEEYQKWLDEGNEPMREYNYDPKTQTSTDHVYTVDEYVDKYISEISKNYNQLTSSTDFEFYVDDNVKVFAKDLKKYNGETLQYIGIMPTSIALKDYLKSLNAKELNETISKLKPLEFSSFKDGYITKITGSIPLFKFEYNLNLLDDLKQLGVKDVFDSKKANLSNLTSVESAYIKDVKHKANIEFSNDGIKASAATSVMGGGAAGGGFDYLYNVPIEVIDLTFDKPYMFIIRDKDTGEVWFTGTVYKPIEYTRGTPAYY